MRWVSPSPNGCLARQPRAGGLLAGAQQGESCICSNLQPRPSLFPEASRARTRYQGAWPTCSRATPPEQGHLFQGRTKTLPHATSELQAQSNVSLHPASAASPQSTGARVPSVAAECLEGWGRLLGRTDTQPCPPTWMIPVLRGSSAILGYA